MNYFNPNEPEHVEFARNIFVALCGNTGLIGNNDLKPGIQSKLLDLLPKMALNLAADFNKELHERRLKLQEKKE